MSKSTTPTSKKLTSDDVAAVLSFFSGPKESDRVNAFVGWMIQSGRECPEIAAEIRHFFDVTLRKRTTDETATTEVPV